MENKPEIANSSPTEVSPRKRNKLRWVLGWLLIVVSLIGVGAVVWWALRDDMPANFGDFMEVFATFFPQWPYLLASVGMLIIGVLLATFRFMLLIHASNGRWYAKDSMRVHIIGKYYDFVTPYSLAGEPYQIFHLRKCHLDNGQASSVTLINLYTSRIAFLIVSIGFFIAFPYVVNNDWVRVIAILGALLTTIMPCAWMSLTFSRRFSNWAAATIFRLMDWLKIKNAESKKVKIAQFVEDYKRSIAVFKDHKLVLFSAVPLAILTHIAFLAVAYFVILAVPAEHLLMPANSIDFFQIIAEGMYANNFTALVPTPGGIGGAEFSFAEIFSGYVSGSYLLWAMFIWRFLTFYIYIFVGLALVIISAGFKKRAKSHPKQQLDKIATFQFIDNFYPSIDGVVKVVENYAIELGKRGYPTTVIAPQYHLNHASEHYPYPVLRVPARRFSWLEYALAKRRLPKNVKQAVLFQQPVVLHAHAPFIVGGYALKLAKKYDLPLVATFHSKYYEDFFAFFNSHFLTRLAIRQVISFYNGCDEVWTVSDYAVGVLRGYGFKGKIRVMPNGTSFAPHCFTPAELALKADEYHIDKRQKNLLFVGHLIQQKNIKLIISSFARLHQLDSSFALTILGVGGHQVMLHQFAIDLGIEAKINWIEGDIPTVDMQAIYANADLLFMPSLYETFSIVLREAAAMGTPALVAEGGAPAEVIQDSVNGFIAPASEQQMVEKILTIFAHPAEMELVGQAAQASIPVHWANIIDNVAENYERLVKEFNARMEIKK